MRRDYENLSVNLPMGGLNLNDIDSKAALLGVNRSQFALMAIESFVNMQDEFLTELVNSAKAAGVSVADSIQQLILKATAWEDVRWDTLKIVSEPMEDFLHVQSKDGIRRATVEETQAYFKEKYAADIEKIKAGAKDEQ